MFEISVRPRFSAAHHLEGYLGSCASPHGHNWEVEIVLQGAELDAAGLLMDFRKVKEAARKLLQGIDHTDLNQAPGLRGVNPTSENIARFLFRRCAAELDSAACRVARVSVQETPETKATYWE